ncbi:MAG TPA: aminoacyl-tRNA hydrolase [Thermodesulfobacteriota bacterium]|nr:aminoacyl-tRNA hydrolase [Thermodesulfobacteriota bacterium]
MKVVAGLGNPGPRYAPTRHNVGFRVVEALARAHGLRFGPHRFDALAARGRVAGEELLLVKPQTFMNESGRCLAPLLAFYRLGPADLLVVHDDLDLALGRIQIRQRGGDGGHNGLRSIIAALGDAGFLRLRVGIGRPPDRQDPADYVLSPFAPEELPVVEQAVGRSVEAIETLLREGVARAMTRFNQILAPGGAPGA